MFWSNLWLWLFLCRSLAIPSCSFLICKVEVVWIAPFFLDIRIYLAFYCWSLIFWLYFLPICLLIVKISLNSFLVLKVLSNLIWHFRCNVLYRSSWSSRLLGNDIFSCPLKINGDWYPLIKMIILPVSIGMTAALQFISGMIVAYHDILHMPSC